MDIIIVDSWCYVLSSGMKKINMVRYNRKIH